MTTSQSERGMTAADLGLDGRPWYWATCWYCRGSGFVWVPMQNTSSSLYSVGVWTQCRGCDGQGRCATYDLDE